MNGCNAVNVRAYGAAYIALFVPTEKIWREFCCRYYCLLMYSVKRVPRHVTKYVRGGTNHMLAQIVWDLIDGLRDSNLAT